MLSIHLALLETAAEGINDLNSFNSLSMPIHQFRWIIILSLIALHTIVAVILTELMGRTYGKWLLWLAVAFCLPVIGPISIYLYHAALSSSLTEARRQSFWQRMLLSGPVSLRKSLIYEQAAAKEIKLKAPTQVKNHVNIPEQDNVIEELIRSGDFAGARGQAWKMMEIAQESHDQRMVERYQEYLEVIAELQSASSGRG